MRHWLKQPLIRVLVIATTVAMCSMALRETASITLPVITALKEVLIPVAIGFTIAYVLTPLVDWVTNKLRVPRIVSAGMFFGFFSLVLVLVLMLVVPTVIRQSASMAERVFKGEQYTDINNNARYDSGEPYEDANGNGRHDATGMFASALMWIEERQGQLRQYAKLELEQPARAFLLLYIAETANERATIDAAMAMVRDNRPVDQWPELLRRDPPADAPLSWNRSWPGASREQVDEAYNKLVPEVRERWVRNLSYAGQTYAAKHADLLTALRYVRRSHEIDEKDPLLPVIERVRNSLLYDPNEIEDQQARQFALRLSEDEQNGQTAARELMVELRGDDSSSQWLAPVVQQLETEVNTQLETLPGRIGNWATSNLTSVNAWLALGLDIILVPIYAFFLILAMPAIRTGVRNHLPEWNKPQMIRIIRDIEKVVAAFFRGRLIVWFFSSGLNRNWCAVCSAI